MRSLPSPQLCFFCPAAHSEVISLYLTIHPSTAVRRSFVSTVPKENFHLLMPHCWHVTPKCALRSTMTVNEWRRISKRVNHVPGTEFLELKHEPHIGQSFSFRVETLAVSQWLYTLHNTFESVKVPFCSARSFWIFFLYHLQFIKKMFSGFFFQLSVKPPFPFCASL